MQAEYRGHWIGKGPYGIPAKPVRFIPASECGESPIPRTAARCDSSGTMKLKSIKVEDGGHGYKHPPYVHLEGGGGRNATCTAKVSHGKITSVQVDNPGSDYTETPTVEFRGDGEGGKATATIGE